MVLRQQKLMMKSGKEAKALRNGSIVMYNWQELIETLSLPEVDQEVQRCLHVLFFVSLGGALRLFKVTNLRMKSNHCTLVTFELYYK